MEKHYSDGFFDVSIEHGFLPISAPLATLPAKYSAVQNLTDQLPELIKDIKLLNIAIYALPEFDLTDEADVFVIQALFRAYTFLTSAYLLAPSYHTQVNGIYGKALNLLPTNLAKPLVCVAGKLDVMPWLDYHYAYSLGNYIKIEEKDPLHWKNLRMACSFTGGQDETGFIMNHVYINEKSPDLLKAIHLYLDGNELEGIKLYYATMLEINARRHTMWQASDHRHYNYFRAFIMGIKGNTEIFGPGVKYETGDEHADEYRQYRGQTGAQDNIIPTSDIFANVIEFYPDNQLTSYLLDLRQYRPKCVQKFFHDLQAALDAKPIKKFFLQHDHTGLVFLLGIINEIYLFRNGHWQFVQKYIMANTKYATASGGTPVISWLPNQIEACLKSMAELINVIDHTSLSPDATAMFRDLKSTFQNKVTLLEEQLLELRKENYNVERIYDLNIAKGLEDEKIL